MAPATIMCHAESSLAHELVVRSRASSALYPRGSGEALVSAHESNVRRRPGVLRIQASMAALALLLLLEGGCESSPPPPPEPSMTEPAPPPLDVFSAARAWSDLLALTSAGPEPSGLDAARAHLLAELGALGVEVREIETPIPDVALPATPSEGGEGDDPPPEDSAKASPAADVARSLRHVVATLPGESPNLQRVCDRRAPPSTMVHCAWGRMATTLKEVMRGPPMSTR